MGKRIANPGTLLDKIKDSKKINRNGNTRIKRKRAKRKRIYFNASTYDSSDQCWLKQIQHPERVHQSDSGHLVYLVLCTYKKKRIIYVGKTNDVSRRWQQHNGMLAGGAAFTTNWVSKGYQWEPVATVAGFKTEAESESFEKRCKVIALSYGKNTLATNAKYEAEKTKLHLKVRKLITVLNQPKWAKRWDWAANTPLHLTWFKPQMKPCLKASVRGKKPPLTPPLNQLTYLPPSRC